MWSYYGSKCKIVDLYPTPKHNKIIEPFAGSARYSLKYFDRDILLVDKYEVVVKIWKWLQQCSEKDILSLPILKTGETTKDYTFDCEEQILLMGFIVARGVSRPQYKVSSFAGSEKQYHFKYTYKNIAKQLFKIKHWEIIQGCYTEIKNEKATWFIDPPYKEGGQNYACSNRDIDFKHLAAWSKERKGQAIVCENTKADWLDFKPLKAIQGTINKSIEVIWSNEITNYDTVQTSLF